MSYSELLNQYHVPEDAGEHEEGLRQVLARIPEGWGRWISCDKGWYPLIIELDQKLAEIAPNYTLHQVKEKFGTLRYYIGFPDLRPQCCINIEATQPIKGPINPRFMRRDEERTVEDQHTLDRWFYEVLLRHYDTFEHIQQDELLEPERQRRRELSEKMEKIVREYEKLSAKTCETCGADAQLNSEGYMYRTLCPKCAEDQGYMVFVDEEGNELGE